jgi:hypothetical protein
MTTILTKKKDTAGAPVAGDLTNAAGGAELAVNTATKRLYTKDSGGNVVEIGTNPSSLDVPVIISGTTTDAALRITQLGTGNALLVEDSTNPDSTPFVIDANGRLVHGNTSALTIRGVTFGNQFIGPDFSGSAPLSLRYSNDTSPSGYEFSKTRSTTPSGNAIVSSGDSIGQLIFSADDGTQYLQAATITAAVDTAPGTNDMPGRLVFSTTADGASTPTERMRIDNAGRVNIGGTSTSTYLSLSGTIPVTSADTVGINLLYTIPSTATTSSRGFYTQTVSTQATAFTLPTFRHFEAGNVTVGAGSTLTEQIGFRVGAISSATNNYGFVGAVASATGAYNLYMSGTANNYMAGSLGIGTTNPITKLEIAGTNNTTWSVTASITGTTMDVTAVGAGTIAVGDLVFNGSIAPYTRVTALGTGTGGIGTYTVSVSQTVTSGTVVGGATYGNTLIRITDLDTGQNVGQPNGALQFYTSDASSPTAGVGAYVAAVAESVTPDTALVFGTRDNVGGGIDANERMRIDSAGIVVVGSPTTVNYGGFTPNFQVNAAGAAQIGLSRFSANNASNAITILKSRGATVNDFTVVASGDSLGRLEFYGADGTTGIPAAQIQAAVDGTPGTNDMPGRLVFSTTADGASTFTERMRIDSSGNVGIGTSSPTSLLQTAGTSAKSAFKTPNIAEVNTISATAATGTINYDVTTQSVLYYTTNASGNFTVNFRGSSGTSLNTVMQTGESISATFLVTNGATAYYNSAVQVDGSSVTPKWQGGTAPTSGNASSIDSYTYVIIKTGSTTFTVLASVTKFA